MCGISGLGCQVARFQSSSHIAQHAQEVNRRIFFVKTTAKITVDHSESCTVAGRSLRVSAIQARNQTCVNTPISAELRKQKRQI